MLKLTRTVCGCGAVWTSTETDANSTNELMFGW